MKTIKQPKFDIAKLMELYSEKQGKVSLRKQGWKENWSQLW